MTPAVGGPGANRSVAVIGEAAVDLVAQVDALPARGGFALARTVRRFAGGSAGNVAAALSRLGHRVSFLGQVGDDDDGRFLAEAFERDKVDTAQFLRVPGYETPRCMVMVEDGGSRTILGFPRTATGLQPGDFNLKSIAEAACVFIGPTHTGLAREVALTADLNGATTCYAPGGLCHCLEPRALEPVLRQTDILFLNEGEATALTGSRDLEPAVGRLANAGPELVVITLGRQGALVVRADERYRVPAAPAPRVRDTTGAGDAFAAGFVAGWQRGLGPEAAARVGGAAAALTIQRLGARVGLPTWEEAVSLAGPHRGPTIPCS